jgi:hypothetical protein
MSTPRAKVYEISDAIQCTPDGFAAYYDRTTGRVEIVPAPDVLEEDDDDDESTDDMPEWEREEHELARRIIEDKSGRYVALPEQFDANEWEMMAGFAASLQDDRDRERLEDAIRGAGAFRRFKGAVHALNLTDRWYAHRDACYAKVAIAWCEENAVEWVPGSERNTPKP